MILERRFNEKKSETHIIIIWCHELVILHSVWKIIFTQCRCMRPRLQGVLFADGGREAAGPFLAWKVFRHVFNRVLVNESRVVAHVV